MKNQLKDIETLITAFDMAAWRRIHDLSQEKAAKILGVSRKQVGRWENRESPLDRRTVLACLFLTHIIQEN